MLSEKLLRFKDPRDNIYYTSTAVSRKIPITSISLQLARSGRTWWRLSSQTCLTQKLLLCQHLTNLNALNDINFKELKNPEEKDALYERQMVKYKKEQDNYLMIKHEIAVDYEAYEQKGQFSQYLFGDSIIKYIVLV